MQKGDVPVTYADTSDLERDFGYEPRTPLREGLSDIMNFTSKSKTTYFLHSEDNNKTEKNNDFIYFN